MMADLNFMDVFLNNDELLPTLERDIFKNKKTERNDVSSFCVLSIIVTEF